MNRVDTFGVEDLCIFCGAETKTESSGGYHNNDYEEYSVCDCDNSTKAKELAVTIQKISYEIDSLKLGYAQQERIKLYHMRQQKQDEIQRINERLERLGE